MSFWTMFKKKNNVKYFFACKMNVDGIVIIQTKLIYGLTICQINMGQKNTIIKNGFIN